MLSLFLCFQSFDQIILLFSRFYRFYLSQWRLLPLMWTLILSLAVLLSSISSLPLLLFCFCLCRHSCPMSLLSFFCLCPPPHRSSSSCHDQSESCATRPIAELGSVSWSTGLTFDPLPDQWSYSWSCISATDQFPEQVVLHTQFWSLVMSFCNWSVWIHILNFVKLAYCSFSLTLMSPQWSSAHLLCNSILV